MDRKTSPGWKSVRITVFTLILIPKFNIKTKHSSFLFHGTILVRTYARTSCFLTARYTNLIPAITPLTPSPHPPPTTTPTPTLTPTPPTPVSIHENTGGLYLASSCGCTGYMYTRGSKYNCHIF